MQQQCMAKKDDAANEAGIDEGGDKLIRRLEKEDVAAAEATSELEKLPSPPASTPSASSSPSHEFSFTISLRRSSTNPFDNSEGGLPSFATDLTPADDIFFHGHLIPLHLLSHLPVSPRYSTHSVDSFELPVREMMEAPRPEKLDTVDANSAMQDKLHRTGKSNPRSSETKGRSTKLKFYSFGLIKWKKEPHVTPKGHEEKLRRKLKFDVSHVVKKYLRMVRPLLLFKGNKREDITAERYPYSCSIETSSDGNRKKGLRGRRGEYSTPASVRTSPTNSGLLVATTALPVSSDSTVEELQAAIQAAITHCKNSLAGVQNSKVDQ